MELMALVKSESAFDSMTETVLNVAQVLVDEGLAMWMSTDAGIVYWS